MVMAITEAEFDAADLAVWTEMARRILKGSAPDSLDRTDEDGLVTRALYPVDAPAGEAACAHLLPAFPHRRIAEGWQVCQALGPGASNADVHEALGSGATALLVQSGEARDLGRGGVERGEGVLPSRSGSARRSSSLHSEAAAAASSASSCLSFCEMGDFARGESRGVRESGEPACDDTPDRNAQVY